MPCLQALQAFRVRICRERRHPDKIEKFEGADNLAAEMNFGEEFDPNNAEAGIKYTLNGAEISYDEYTELCSKIFAAEVNTQQHLHANNTPFT